MVNNAWLLSPETPPYSLSAPTSLSSRRRFVCACAVFLWDAHPCYRVLPLHRVSWFCSLKGNEFFAEVDHDFMQDDFNMTGLSAQVPYFDHALDTILDAESSVAERLSKDQQEAIESAAELLYGLIHARYIITPRGMAAMLEKVRATRAAAVAKSTGTGVPVAFPCLTTHSDPHLRLTRRRSRSSLGAVQERALWAVPARALPGPARAARRPERPAAHAHDQDLLLPL